MCTNLKLFPSLQKRKTNTFFIRERKLLILPSGLARIGPKSSTRLFCSCQPRGEGCCCCVCEFSKQTRPPRTPYMTNKSLSSSLAFQRTLCSLLSLFLFPGAILGSFPRKAADFAYKRPSIARRADSGTRCVLSAV